MGGQSQNPADQANGSPAGASPAAPQDLLAGFEQSFGQIKKLYSERQQLETKLLESQSALLERERALQEQTQQAASLREELESTKSTLAAQVVSCRERIASLDAELASLRGREADFAARERELADLRAQADLTREADDINAKKIAADLDQLANELHQLQSDLDGRKKSLEDEKAALERERVALAETSATLLARERTLEALQNELNEREIKLNAARSQLESDHQEFGERLAKVERLEELEQACIAMREKLEEASTHAAELQVKLTKAEAAALTAGKSATSDAASKRREQELVSLRERFAKAEADLKARAAESDALRAELKKSEASAAELLRMATEADDRQAAAVKELQELKATLAQQTAAPTREQTDAADQAAASAGASEIAELEAVIEQLRDRLRTEIARVRELEERVNAAPDAGPSSAPHSSGPSAAVSHASSPASSVESHAHDAAEHSSSASDAESRRLLAELGDQLKETLAALQQSQSEAERLRSQNDRLSREARQLAGDAPSGESRVALRVRRERLRRVRTLLRDQARKVRKASEVLAKRFEACEALLAQRQELLAAKRTIDEVGRRYQRQKAGGKAAATVFYVTGALGLLGGLSWALVEHFTPGTYLASATVIASSRDRELTPQEQSDWQRSMQNTLTDPGFLEVTADRMAKRGFESLKAPAALRDRLAEGLRVDPALPGELSLEIQGEGADTTQRLLETVVISLVSETNATRERRSDGAITEVSQPAKASSKPLKDDRLMHAAIVFGGSVLLAGVLGLLVWSRLVKAKSEFEKSEQIDDLLSDARWTDPRV